MRTPVRVLIAEDYENDASLILNEMRRGGYEPRFQRVDTKEDFQSCLDKESWDLILSDYVMPSFSGLDALRQTKAKRPDIPFILFSGKIDEETAVEAMKAGAHDIVLKGNLARLVPAIKREIHAATVRKEAEEALRASEQINKEIITTAYEGIVLCDVDLRYIIWNPFMEELTGVPADQVLGRCALEVFPHLIQQGIDSYYRRALDGEMVKTPDTPFDIPQTGRTGWVAATYWPRRNDQGEIVGVIGIVHDITERKRHEEALRRSERRLDLALKGSGLAFWDLNVRTGEAIFDERWAEILGYPVTELTSNLGAWQNSLHPDDITGTMAELMDHLEGKKSDYYTEYRIRTRSGNWKWIADSGKIYEWDDEGKPLRAAGTHLDITERKQAEQELRESESRFRLLIERAPDGIFVQTQGRFSYANKAALRIFGAQSTDELLGRPFIEYIHPNYRDVVRERSRLVSVEKKEVPSQDQVYLRLDGAPVEVAVSVVPIRYEGQDGALVFIRDNTERKRAEIALRESERQIRALLDNIPDIVWLKDKESRFIAVNEPFGKTCGFKPEELVGKTDLDIFPMDLAEAYRADDKEVIQSGRTKRVEEFLEDARGKRNWIETFKTAIRNDQGDVIGTTGIARDITERKRVEDLYRMLSDKSLGGVYVVQDGIFKYINANAASYAGYSPEELIGREAGVLLHDGDKALAQKYAGEMLRGGRQTPYEIRIINKAGNIRWILETVTTIPYEGKPAVLGNSMDISQIKEAQRKLEDLKALESSILATIPHAVMGIKNRHIIFANEGVENVFGWKREELINKSTRILFRSDEAYTDFGTALYTTIEKEKTISGEYDAHFRHKDGRNLICRVTASRIGETLTDKYITTTIEDVTALRNIQMQLLQSEKMSSIGQLAAGVAHEINNPTGYVSSNLKTLEEYFNDMNSVLSKYEALLGGVKEGLHGRLSPESLSDQADAIESAKREVDLGYILNDVPNLIQESRQGTERIRNIVIDLKNFAHPGKAEFELADIVKNIESTLNVVWNELKYKATIHKDYGELPPIMCIPQQLNQVFMNLLVNAAHAIKDKGDITIRTRRQDGHVEVSIQDTGCGIPTANISKVFDPFFTTKEVGKGTGLGLNVAYNIVKKHRGTIDVTSKVGEGTTFTILLPVNQEEGKA